MNREHISNESVLLDVRRMTCAEGKGKGTDLFRITNMAGLDFDVLIDRCMGIGQLRADGSLISYTSETGIVHPSYYEKEGFNWLRSFGGGFLATCGLTQVGEPCEGHGLHGRIDNIPAEQVSWQRWWEGDVLWAEVRGIMYEACHQGEYLSLCRTIRLNHIEKRIWVEDVVKNHGSTSQPFMLLYHINMGAPFLKEGTKVTLPKGGLSCFDTVAATHTDCSRTVPDVSEARLDLLWLHDPEGKSRTQTAMVDNGSRQVQITWSSDTLPILGQWELLQPRGYVLALEPTNTHLQGQDWERANGSLQFLMPDETCHTTLQFSF